MPYPTTGDFTTSPTYSGSFIPTLWSSKLNAKFYKATVFGEIANTDWEGEIKNMGDKVTINNVPDLTISNYTVGGTLSYQVPTPSTITLNIDKGKSFAFKVSDVLAYQSDIKLIDTFSDDAASKMKVAIDSTVIFNTFSKAAAANKGATAGVNSGGIDLGTDATPVTLTATNVLDVILRLAAVLDEQNAPESDRWLLLDPLTRQLLMQSNLAQAQYTGDASSPVRNGKIGGIDRFTVYVTNNLPRAAAALDFKSGDGSEGGATAVTGAPARRVLVAGHKSAITFASQMTKMETLPNQNDFGSLVRGLNVYGYEVVKPDTLTFAVVK